MKVWWSVSFSNSPRLSESMLIVFGSARRKRKQDRLGNERPQQGAAGSPSSTRLDV
jgi:hypothetical protein